MFLKKSGFPKSQLTFLPLSGFVGENLSSVSKDCPLSTWYFLVLLIVLGVTPRYKGPTLVEAIDKLPPPSTLVEHATRMVVSDVYKNSQMGMAVAVGGKIEGTQSLYLSFPFMHLCNSWLRFQRR